MAFRIGKRTRPELRTADQLRKQGKLLAAIDLLTSANRELRDIEIERRLVELRFAAFSELESTQPAPSWPPSVPDLFPGATGAPEIAKEQLTAEVLQSAIFHHGSLLVRALLDEPSVDLLVDDVDRAFAAHDEWSEMRRPHALEGFTPLADYDPADRTFAREADGVLAVESPAAFFDIVELFEDLGIRELATEFLGEPPVLLANKWTLRRVQPKGDPDWHQDGSFMGEDIRSLDVWIALSECGEDAPGLDLVGRRIDHVVETGTDGAVFDWTVGPGMVERVAQGTLVRPVFHPGDTMFFDHLCLHRTGAHPGMTRPRYALEAWFAAPSSYPAGQMPIAY
jgi:hypothetical protein